jgi:sulfur carrier protein
VIVTVNGEDRELDPGSTVADVLESLGTDADARGVAVAVEGEVVPRGRWVDRALQAGDHVEVVAAIQGG